MEIITNELCPLVFSRHFLIKLISIFFLDWPIRDSIDFTIIIVHEIIFFPLSYFLDTKNAVETM